MPLIDVTYDQALGERVLRELAELLPDCASDYLAGFSRRTVTGSSILSRSNDPVPVETRLHRDAAPGGSYETSRHRAGRRRLSAPLLCRWRFTCEPARAASVGALGHGRLPGSYEELVAAR